MGVKTLARQSSHYLVGQVAMMALGFASFPVFTRVLSLADYGTIDLLQRLVLLGTALGKLGVQNAVIRFYEAQAKGEGEDGLRRHVSSAIVGTTLSGLLVGAVLSLIFFYSSPAGPANYVMAMFAGLLALLRIQQAIFLNVLRVEERTKLYTITTVGTRLFTLVAIFGLFFLRGKGLETYFAGTVAVEAVAILALAAWLMRRGLLGWAGMDWTMFKSMVAFGAPLIAFETLTVMMDAGDRFLIRYFLGAESLGLYTAAFALCLYIHDLMMAPLNMALTPLYLRIWQNDGAERTSVFLGQALRMFVMAACGLLAGVIVCAPDAVVLLASKKYAGAAPLVPWIAGGMFLYAANSFFNAGMVIHKRTKDLAWFSLTIVVFKLAANSLLLPRLGLNGAVISTVAAYGLFMALTARASLPLLPLRLDVGTLVRAGAACALAALCGSWWRIDSHVVGFLVRGTSAVVVYGGVMAAVDGEARGYLRQGWLLLRRRLGSGSSLVLSARSADGVRRALAYGAEVGIKSRHFQPEN